MKVVPALVLSAVVLSGCVVWNSSDPVHNIGRAEWAEGERLCKGHGGLLKITTYIRPSVSLKAICRNGPLFSIQ